MLLLSMHYQMDKTLCVSKDALFYPCIMQPQFTALAAQGRAARKPQRIPPPKKDAEERAVLILCVMELAGTQLR